MKRRKGWSRAHSPTFPSLHLRHNSFYNPSFASSTSQFILQPFFRLPYVTSSSLNSPGRAHSPTFSSLHPRHNSFSNRPSLYVRHKSFCNPSVASPTSQFILQSFFRLSYVTSSSLNSPGEPPMIYGQQNVRDNTGQNSKDIHPAPG